jgi:hypothetical protein
MVACELRFKELVILPHNIEAETIHDLASYYRKKSRLHSYYPRLSVNVIHLAAAALFREPEAGSGSANDAPISTPVTGE